MYITVDELNLLKRIEIGIIIDGNDSDCNKNIHIFNLIENSIKNECTNK